MDTIRKTLSACKLRGSNRFPARNALKLAGAAVLASFLMQAAYPAELPDYDKACHAYDRGDFYTAYYDLMPHAVRGNAHAQFLVAEMLRTGLGTKRNLAEALIWYRRAAEQGHTAAQCNLGTSLYNGWGAPADPQTAIDWWLTAAIRGNGHALYNLALMLAGGRYIVRDNVRAYRLFKAAMEGDYPLARDLFIRLGKKLSADQRQRAEKMTVDDALTFNRRKRNETNRSTEN